MPDSRCAVLPLPPSLRGRASISKSPKRLAEAFPSALTGAIGEVFLVAAAVVVLAFGLSLFLRSENEEETR